MKCLCSQLNSIVHHHASSSRESLTLSDQIDEATKYIKQKEEIIAELKQKKDHLVDVNGKLSSRKGYSLNSPVQIEVHVKGSALEVILVTGLECEFVFTEAIRIVLEEHAEVVNASYSVVGTTVFHSIHAKGKKSAQKKKLHLQKIRLTIACISVIGEDAARPEVARITERLKKFAL
ncbi:hypothetical protein BVRB_8g183050 isoform A [Beta vulgaris subsp. vulgaris]|nr:hypothetical protein BVRB_8g183050 isoform A [Beta vulgaris subsp. vulgaris]